MQSKAATVEKYLAELSVDRREAIQEVREVILKNVDPLIEEGMQYGMIGFYVPHRVYPAGYHCDPKQPLPFVCLGAQKNYNSLYLGCIYGSEEIERKFREDWAKSGKKLDMGKCCVRFKKADDLALEAVAGTIRKMTVKRFIEFYEAVIKNARRKGSAKGTKAKGGRAKR